MRWSRVIIIFFVKFWEKGKENKKIYICIFKIKNGKEKKDISENIL